MVLINSLAKLTAEPVGEPRAGFSIAITIRLSLDYYRGMKIKRKTLEIREKAGFFRHITKINANFMNNFGNLFC